MLSDGNPTLEKELRRMPIYDFNFRILTLKKNQARTSKIEEGPFGFK